LVSSLGGVHDAGAVLVAALVGADLLGGVVAAAGDDPGVMPCLTG
jgi:hypothetical protein